jgi:hypothetical protein
VERRAPETLYEMAKAFLSRSLAVLARSTVSVIFLDIGKEAFFLFPRYLFMLCFGLILVFTMFQFHPFLRNGGILEIEFRIIIPSANISRYLFGFLAFGFYVVPSNKSNGTAFLNPFLFSFPCSSRTSIRFLRRYYIS